MNERILAAAPGDHGEDDAAAVAAEAARHLRWLVSAGVVEVPPPRAPAAAPARSAAEAASERAPALSGAPRQSGVALPADGAPAAQVRAAAGAAPASTSASAAYGLEDKGCGSAALLQVRAEVGECQRCKLGAGRTRLVFGVGNPAAELVFVGEGPGAEEDQQGEPFVGRAGQLLTKMIEAMGYRREDVYIANVVKCRPPENRNPEPDEIEACEPFLRAQLAAIRPRAIVALGKFAAQTLLRDATPITKLRGRWSRYEGVPLMPTFHPAYLLRSPAEKKKAWEDLQSVMKELGKAGPERP